MCTHYFQNFASIMSKVVLIVIRSLLLVMSEIEHSLLLVPVFQARKEVMKTSVPSQVDSSLPMTVSVLGCPFDVFMLTCKGTDVCVQACYVHTCVYVTVCVCERERGHRQIRLVQNKTSRL